MGILRNPNEENYVGGRKHFKDVIKNTGSPDALICLAGEEDFNNNSVLIVEASQEAVFMNGGLVERVLPEGRYVLNTNNYPFLSRLRNMLSGGVSTYHCKIYFIKKSVIKEMFWGTDSYIQVRDPNLGIQTELSARGSYKFRVRDSDKFLVRLTGSNVKEFGESDLIQFFRSQFMSYIKSVLAKVIAESQREILGINARQMELAKEILPYMETALKEYGLELVDFSIESIDIVDDDNRRNIEAGYAGILIAKSRAQGEKIASDTLGISYFDKRTLDILQDMANNPGAGGMSGMAGVGAGMAAGEWMYKLLSGMNGQSQNPAEQDAGVGEEKLERLKALLEKGLISQEKYEEAAEEVVRTIVSG